MIPTDEPGRFGHSKEFFAKCLFLHVTSVVVRDPNPTHKPNLPMETQSTPTPFMLLFRNTGPENFQHLSPEERQQCVTRWNEWFEGLVAQGKAIEGQPLEMETRLVSGPGGSRITDGPFPEAKEAIGGYVTVMVSDLEEATAIARKHPGLAHGMMIEVRQMTPDCHLGVTTRARGRSKQEVTAG